MIPTFEVQTHSFLFGGRTLPNGSEVRVDGTTAVDLYPALDGHSAKHRWGVRIGHGGWSLFCGSRLVRSTLEMIFEMRWLR